MRVAIESLEREDEGQKRWIIAISVICVALLLLGGLIGGYYHRLQQKVLQQALIEKSIQDSLVLVVNKSVQQATIWPRRVIYMTRGSTNTSLSQNCYTTKQIKP